MPCARCPSRCCSKTSAASTTWARSSAPATPPPSRKLILCGYTAYPPHKRIAKTALGAEEVVAWEHHRDPAARVRDLRQARYEIAVVETSLRSVDLFDWVPAFPVCVVFGNEVTGVTPALLEMCDTHVRIPMLGRKHSLNVATAGGVVIYELVRKYRRMLESVP